MRLTGLHRAAQFGEGVHPEDILAGIWSASSPCASAEIGVCLLFRPTPNPHPQPFQTLRNVAPLCGSGLGYRQPGIPEPSQAKAPAGPHRHKLPAGYRVNSSPVLGGLHHEYRLEKEAA